MLPAIKSILAGLTPSSLDPKPGTASPVSTSVSTSDVVQSQVELKQKQLRRGTTNAKVESLQAEVDAARTAAARTTQDEGRAIYEGRNSTAEAQAAQQAGHRRAALEAALAIAIQKDDAAQAELLEASRQVEVAIDDEANQELKDSTWELEAVLRGVLNPAVDRVAKARLVVKDRSSADSATGSALRDFDLWFKVYLRRSCAALIPGSDGYSVPIDKEGKRLSDWVDAVIYSFSWRRKG